MRESIREELLLITESDYKKFTSALLPGIENVLGVRLPILREMAKKIAKNDWRNELAELEDIYFEEIMLRGLIIGYSNTDIDETLDYITGFVPKINSWSICDSFCVSLKIIQKNRDIVWEYLQKYLNSDKEFDVRFGLISLLDHYIKCDENGKSIPRLRTVTLADVENDTEQNGEYIESVLQVLNREFTQGYYTQMAVAWTIAEAFCTFPYKTMKTLEQSKMDDFTYKKAVQKICESRIPSDEVKKMLRKLQFK